MDNKFNINLNQYLLMMTALKNKELEPSQIRNILINSNNIINIIDVNGNNLYKNVLNDVDTFKWLTFVICNISGMSLENYIINNN